MAKLDETSTIEAHLKAIEAEAKASDKEYNKERSYAYIFGHSLSAFENLLKDLNLTQKQLKVLKEKQERMEEYRINKEKEVATNLQSCIM
jgi:hypothetical protein